MGKVVGFLVLLGVIGIFFLVYSQTYQSSNLTAWSAVTQNIMGSMFPLLVGGVVVFLIVLTVFVYNRK